MRLDETLERSRRVGPLGMVLLQDGFRRRLGYRIGEGLAIGVDMRGLYRDEQILEQDLRRIGKSSCGFWPGRRGRLGRRDRLWRRRDRQQCQPERPAGAAANGAGSHPFHRHNITSRVQRRRR